MINNRKLLSENFSRCLNQSLFLKFGSIPSAIVFSNYFNLRASGTTTITPETARKWMKGKAIPEMERFMILVNWLGVIPNEIFEIFDSKNSIEQNKSLHQNLISIVDNLDVKSLEFVYLVTWVLREKTLISQQNLDFSKLFLHNGNFHKCVKNI